MRGSARVFTHMNGDFELTWLERGRVEFEVGSRVLAATAGACVFLPPGIENTPCVRTASWAQLYLPPAMLDEAADALGSAGRVPREGRVLGAGERLSTLMGLIAADAELGPADPGVAALVDALAVALVRKAPPATRDRRVDARIRRALDRMREAYAEPLTVGALAEAAGMTRFAFLRTFRAQVGESPYQHLIQLRLEQAAERLRRTDASVLEVSLDCGFGDPGRFARLFRRRYGCAPRGYRAGERRAAHDPLKR